VPAVTFSPLTYWRASRLAGPWNDPFGEAPISGGGLVPASAQARVSEEPRAAQRGTAEPQLTGRCR